MAPYHHIAVHFPVALLGIAFLVLMLRGTTRNDRVERLEGLAIVPLLSIGIAGAVAAQVTGLLIWPLDAALTSTMGRNKLLMASWLVATWALVLILRILAGPAIWNGRGRIVLLGLGAFGAFLLATVGSLGGHLLGAPSRLSDLLHQLGWSVYQTFYAPDPVLTAMVAVGAAAIVVGLLVPGASSHKETR
ncbi:MAG TPA: heme ABC transporter permease [Candidatus Omnitrophota bacterium]|nr:heme ABC transporter permease [Candidatus Omnitrophota bacterium]